MNWIANMNNALEYIENNIEKNIKSEEVAKIAYSSKFHFLRTFYMLTGMTLNEYIRQRKLSLAVKDVISSDSKIIDIAFKYGYETPEAFSKAFKRLHGISPTKARKKGKNLKAIPPLSFQITVKGENRMNYRIVEKEGFKIVGLSKRITTKNNENLKVIPKFWQEVNESGKCKELSQDAGSMRVMGVILNHDKEQEEFDYMIAIEAKGAQESDNYEEAYVPSCTWAVFESIGPMPDAIQRVWHKIFAEWFPATKYEHADAPELEVYLPGDPNDKDYKCEIWIPVTSK